MIQVRREAICFIVAQYAFPTYKCFHFYAENA